MEYSLALCGRFALWLLLLSRLLLFMRVRAWRVVLSLPYLTVEVFMLLRWPRALALEVPCNFIDSHFAHTSTVSTTYVDAALLCLFLSSYENVVPLV